MGSDGFFVMKIMVVIAILFFGGKWFIKFCARQSKDNWVPMPESMKPKSAVQSRTGEANPKNNPGGSCYASDPKYICELCGARITSDNLRPTRFYKNLKGEERAICWKCGDHHYYGDDEPVPEELLARYDIRHGHKEWKKPMYADWIEYQKISLRQFNGEITEEEARAETAEMTRLLCEKYDKEREKVERERAEAQAEREKGFWHNRKTFY